MLTAAQEKLIKSLQTSKGRNDSGLCLVEGVKNITVAKKFVEFNFSSADSKNFKKLVTTETPQDSAAVARIPVWRLADIAAKKVMVVLDNVQDPGNVGTILRLCLGFDAGLILIDSADPTAPKVIRASAGALFATPWLRIKSSEAEQILCTLDRPVYLLQIPSKKTLKIDLAGLKKLPPKLIIVAGSEGQGIKLKINGQSLTIPHNEKLESLNVAASLAILLGLIYLR